MGLTEFIFNLKWFLGDLFDKPLGVFKKWRRQKTAGIFVICFAALVLVIPLIVIVTVKIISATPDKETATEYVFKPGPVAVEDIFIPEEPDFLPPALLEQERKNVWTEEDASKFWTDPEEFPNEFWRDRISDSIDRLLEPLP
jgi:hypothetical protein